MKILIILILLIAAVFGVTYFCKKKKKSKNNDAYNDAVQEVWKDTKRTSERVNLSEKTRKASDKLNDLSTSTTAAAKKNYGPRVDPILEEGGQALSEMEKIQSCLKDEEIKPKISEIMSVTEKIMQQAIDDPDDIPQIKKFFSYYLPTTVKLLHSYETMEKQEITGENINKTKKNIQQMLDVVVEAYKKRLDSLFENQALDIETEIDVMNQMLTREGLTEKKDFEMKEGTQNG